MKPIAFFAAALLSATAVWAAATPAPAPAPSAAAKPAAAPAKPATAAAPAAKRDELWFIAKAADGAIAYDAKSIKQNPELSTVGMISLVYLKAGAKTPSGAVYYYILSEDQLDCIGPQYKPKTRVVFDITGKLMDAGDAPPNAAWSSLKGNAPLNALRGVACSGATFKNMTQAPNFAAAIKTMKELK